MLDSVSDSGLPKLDESNALRGSEEPNSVQNIDGNVAMALSSSHCELIPQYSIEDCCAREPSGSEPSGSMSPACAQLDERFHALAPPSVSPQCDVLNGSGLVPDFVDLVTHGNALLPCKLSSEMVCEAVMGTGVGPSMSNLPPLDVSEVGDAVKPFYDAVPYFVVDGCGWMSIKCAHCFGGVCFTLLLLTVVLMPHCISGGCLSSPPADVPKTKSARCFTSADAVMIST
ncbi:hypothetical protein Nepgr_004053 [Nepenthes gracilis]|uniref:Uncharacterized protein n=1 Tax=Nepenthes gracilis TaxID=150966 RepID=A0AAD3S0S4_NEPGR|nr:hypothetical protein Nepgr_004053 [Nepenthes gracilis]